MRFEGEVASKDEDSNTILWLEPRAATNS